MSLIYLIPLISNSINATAYDSMASSIGIYFAKTTIGGLNPTPFTTSSLSQSSSQKYKMMNAIPDLIAILLFLVFCIYWEIKSDKLTE
jgi:hypothetical protein